MGPMVIPYVGCGGGPLLYMHNDAITCCLQRSLCELKTSNSSFPEAHNFFQFFSPFFFSVFHLSHLYILFFFFLIIIQIHPPLSPVSIHYRSIAVPETLVAAPGLNTHQPTAAISTTSPIVFFFSLGADYVGWTTLHGR